MPMLTLSFAPQTRTAEAAVKAPRKNLRVVLSDTMRLLSRLLYQVVGCSLERMPPPARGPSSDSGGPACSVTGCHQGRVRREPQDFHRSGLWASAEQPATSQRPMA